MPSADRTRPALSPRWGAGGDTCRCRSTGAAALRPYAKRPTHNLRGLFWLGNLSTEVQQDLHTRTFPILEN